MAIICFGTSLRPRGAKYRGEFEERLKNIIQEVRDDPNIILMTLGSDGEGRPGYMGLWPSVLSDPDQKGHLVKTWIEQFHLVKNYVHPFDGVECMNNNWMYNRQESQDGVVLSPIQ